jgi:hypothetical protein
MKKFKDMFGAVVKKLDKLADGDEADAASKKNKSERKK